MIDETRDEQEAMDTQRIRAIMRDEIGAYDERLQKRLDAYARRDDVNAAFDTLRQQITSQNLHLEQAFKESLRGYTTHQQLEDALSRLDEQHQDMMTTKHATLLRVISERFETFTLSLGTQIQQGIAPVYALVETLAKTNAAQFENLEQGQAELRGAVRKQDAEIDALRDEQARSDQDNALMQQTLVGTRDALTTLNTTMTSGFTQINAWQESVTPAIQAAQRRSAWESRVIALAMSRFGIAAIAFVVVGTVLLIANRTDLLHDFVQSIARLFGLGG